MMQGAIEARARSKACLERARGSAVQARGGGGPFLTGGMGSGGGNSGTSRQQSMALASEQYRHYSGWVHSIIKIIAQRIAGQPMRIARVVSQDEQRSLQGMLQKGNPFRRELAKARLAQIRSRRPAKGTVPAFVKEYRQAVEVMEDHPILDIMRRPNPIMTRSVMMQNTVASLELTGRAYWWFVKPGDVGSTGDPQGPNGGIEIWPLPSSWVEPVHEPEKLYAEWSITPPGGGEAIKVPGGQIGYMYYPDPSNPLGALAPLQAQSRAVVVDEAALEAQRRGMANGLFPGLALIVGRDPDIGGMQGQRPVLKKEQRAQLIAAVKQAYRGVQNNDEPIILDGLITDAKPVTTSPREMAFMETGKMSKERLTQGWGVNPISMGQVEGANRASSATADEHFICNVINPRLELISEVLTRWLPALVQDDIPDEDQLVYFEPARSSDPDLERSQLAFMAETACVSRNEIRAHFGYPPIEDGDSIFLAGFGEVLIRAAEQDEAPALDAGDGTQGDRGFPLAIGGMGRARFRR